ncbi:AAA family ATPase [Candidatus Parabeggiatoa sp. HSG14]|uniref:NHL domain-containing protein n=1 Tax=Candidatus Parabeggiatoa sp. HSG14 TaxID=3055593 RepID=UPI0025A77D32|nr:AAA family ATPase [Thiotrichales bacterium HSG14]
MWKLLLSFLLLSWLSYGQAAYLIYDFAGSGDVGFNPDDNGGLAVKAKLTKTRGLAIDKAGNVFFADVENRRVRKVDIKTGIITTVAGCHKQRSQEVICESWRENEDNPEKYKALETQLSAPIDVAIDNADNLYILDRGDSRVYKVEKGYISPVVNEEGNHGYSGDGEPAIEASIDPNFGGISIDYDNNLYIADRANNRILKVDAETQRITTVAGNGEGGYDAGENLKATETKLNLPEDVLVDRKGNIFIADSYNHLIRKVDTNGNITTIAGIQGKPGYNGDNQPAIKALFNLPIGIAMDNSDNLYIADFYNNRIRKLEKTDQGYIISTVAGNGEASLSSIVQSNSISPSYKGEFSTQVSLHNPEDVALVVGRDGNITMYIADHQHYRIRQLKWTDKESPDYTLLVISIFTILIIFLSILYYFGLYTHPDVKRLIANPSELFNFSLEQLASIRRLLKYTGNLESVLDANNIEEVWLDNAIKFIAKRTPNSKRCELLAERLSATFKSVDENIFELKISEAVPLNLSNFLVYFPPVNLSVSDVFIQLQQEKMGQDYVIVISLKRSQRLKLITQYEQDSTNQWIIPNGKELLRLFLLPSDGIKTFVHLAKKNLIAVRISPYQTHGGITKSSLFFGRDAVIDQIVYGTPQNYFLMGGRGIGKTSILKEIRRRYQENHQEVNCLFFSSSENFLLGLTHELNLPKDASPLEILIELVERSKPKHCLVLLDEADNFIKQEVASSCETLKVLRQFSEDGSCYFVLAGFWELFKNSVDHQSPIHNFAKSISEESKAYIKITALESKACKEMITKPMKLFGIDSTEVVEEIITVTGGRANLIAMICDQIVQTAPENGKITEILSALQSLEIYKALAGWVRLTKDEEHNRLDRIIVYSTVEKGEFTREDLDLKQFPLPPNWMNDSLLRLEIAFIIKRIGNKYDYCVPLFRDMLLEQDVKALLEQEF